MAPELAGQIAYVIERFTAAFGSAWLGWPAELAVAFVALAFCLWLDRQHYRAAVHVTAGVLFSIYMAALAIWLFL